MRTTCLLFVMLFARLSIAQNTKADNVIGDWMDSKKQTLVRCYKEKGKYYAKTLWIENLADIGKPLPKEEQYWINMIVMKDFDYDADADEWVNGTIYQPRTDKTYTAYLKLTDQNTLLVTGYVWFRIFSESESFTRVVN